MKKFPDAQKFTGGLEGIADALCQSLNHPQLPAAGNTEGTVESRSGSQTPTQVSTQPKQHSSQPQVLGQAERRRRRCLIPP